MLDKWAAGRRVPLRLVQRAQIICKAAQGLLSKDIARTLHISRPTVQLWRQRFLALRLPGLEKWSEPLKWHTELGTVSGKGNDGEEKAILPEISTNGRGADENVRKRR